MANRDRIRELNEERLLQQSILDTLLAQARSDEERLKIKKGEIQTSSVQGKTYKQHLELLKEINEQIKEQRDEIKSTIDNYVSIESKLKGLKGLQSSLVDKERARIKIMANSTNLDVQKREIFDSIASLQNDLLNTSSEDIVQQAEINRQLDSLYSSLGNVNGIHRHIVKNLKEQRGIADSVSSLTEDQQEQLNSQIEAYDTIKNSIGKVFSTLDLMTKGPAIGFGFALVGAGLAAEELFKSVQKTGGFLGEFSLSTAGLGVLFDEAQSVAEGLATQLGSTEEASFGTQLNVNLMAKNLGLSGDEASNLIGSFSRLNGNSTDIALDMMTSVKETAKLKGVIPNKVMSDLAASADAFATYSKDGGQNIVEAAVYARQLGVSFDKLSSVADGLLDFESSITKELELGAMLGRNINLNEARRLAYAGDLEGMGREILNQMGGIAAFNDMDVFQKKAAADALGVSVGELQTMLANAEKATGEVSLLEKSFNTISESITAASTTFGGQFLQALGGGLVTLGQMGTGFETLKKSQKFIAMQEAISTKYQAAKLAIQKTYTSLVNGELVTKTKTWIGEKLNNGMLLLKNGYQSVSNFLSSQELGFKRSGWLLSKLSAGWELAKIGYQKIKLMLLGKEIAAMSTRNAIEATSGATGAIGGAAKGAGMAGMAAGLAAMGSPPVLLGLAAVTAAIIGIGFALRIAAPGIEAFGSAISSILMQVVPVVMAVGSVITSIFTGIADVVKVVFNGLGEFFKTIVSVATPEIAFSVMSLATSFAALTASLLAFSVAGLVALPAMLAVGTFANLGLVGGGGELDGGAGDTKMDELITEIRGLRSDLNNGKIGVNMDGKKVTAAVSRVTDKIGANSYGL